MLCIIIYLRILKFRRYDKKYQCYLHVIVITQKSNINTKMLLIPLTL